MTRSLRRSVRVIASLVARDRRRSRVGASAARRASACNDCGVVHVDAATSRRREGIGLGAVAGGVAGRRPRPSDRQRTRQHGRRPIAGAGGRRLRRQQGREEQEHEDLLVVAIRMDNGNTRSFTYSNQPAVHEGERVKLVDGGRGWRCVAN